MTVSVTTHEGRTTNGRWFNRGFAIHDAENIKQILTKAGMNWKVSKRPIVTTRAVPPRETGKNPNLMGPNGTYECEALRHAVAKLLTNPTDKELHKAVQQALKDSNRAYLHHTEEFSIVRDDINRPFGVMGRVYEVFTNASCLSIIESLLDEKKIIPERAGVFDYGAKCWVLFKLPGSIHIGDVVLDQYVRISWSHDGTEKLSATFIALDIKNNTQFSPDIKIKGVRDTRSSIEIRHTTNGQKRIEAAEDLFTSGEAYFNRLEGILTELVNKPMTSEELDKYLQDLIPDTKKDIEAGKSSTRASKSREEILSIFANIDESVSYTKFAGFSAVAQWANHDKTVRVTGLDEEESKDDSKKVQVAADNRLKNLWAKGGSARELMNKAWASIIKN